MFDKVDPIFLDMLVGDYFLDELPIEVQRKGNNLRERASGVDSLPKYQL
ncbi:MAG: hypothetical protein AAF696_18800 [Bacteroidota bacterium]